MFINQETGLLQAIQTGGVKCCWVCSACKLNEFLLDEFTCEACPPGWLPNENLTGKTVHDEHVYYFAWL